MNRVWNGAPSSTSLPPPHHFFIHHFPLVFSQFVCLWFVLLLRFALSQSDVVSSVFLLIIIP